MFKGLANLGQMMKQAQEMSGKMAQVSEELKAKKITADAGGGMVTIEANGIGEAKKVSIDPKLFESGEREMIEDLLVAAFNQVSAKAKQLNLETMQEMTGGMNLPGLEEAMEKLTGQDPESE